MNELPHSSAEPPTERSTSLAPGRIFQSSALGFCVLRVGMYLVMAYTVSSALRWTARLWIAVESPYSPTQLALAEATALMGTLTAAWVMSRLEARPFGAYGLPQRGAFGKNFRRGIFFGLAEISAVIGPLAAGGFYHFGRLAVHGREILHWALVWAAVFLLVALSEEFSFRGYVQFTLAQGMGFWPAAFLLSFLFGLAHWWNPGETRVGIAGVVLTGLFWCFTLRRTGTLWLAVGMHATFDFGETFLYSVPDSGMIFPGHLSSATLSGPAWATGGNAGPEGSVFDFLALLIFFLIVRRLYPETRDSAHP